MLKKILSYGFIEGLAKGLNKSTLLLLPFFLSTTDFGKIGLLVSVELLIPLLSFLGMEKAVLRFYNEKRKYRFFDKTVSVATLISHSFLLLLLLILYFSNIGSIFSLKVFPDLFLIIVLVYLQGYNLIKLNMLRVEERHKLYYKGRLFFQLTKFSFILLIVYLSGEYLGYLYGGILGGLLTYIYLNLRFEKTGKEKFQRSTFQSLFLFSWPFMLHGLSTKILANADKFIMENYLSLDEVGIYTFAYSIGSMMVFAYIGVSVYMEPLIYKSKNNEKLELLLNKYLTFALIFGLIVYLLITMMSNYFIPLLYNKSYNDVLKFIPLIALAYMIYPYYLRSNYRMIYNKSSFSIAVISILSAVLNIILNILLIPEYGIKAAVFTTGVSFFFQSLLFSLRSNDFRFSMELLQIIFLGSTVLLGIYYKVPYYFSVAPVILIIFMNNYKNIKPIFR